MDTQNTNMGSNSQAPKRRLNLEPPEPPHPKGANASSATMRRQQQTRRINLEPPEPPKVSKRPGTDAHKTSDLSADLLHICRTCGMEFPVLCTSCAATVSADTVVPLVGWLPCSACGQSFWVICPHCQRTQQEQSTQEQRAPQAQPQKQDEQWEQPQQMPQEQSQQQGPSGQQRSGRITDARGLSVTPRVQGTSPQSAYVPPRSGSGGGTKRPPITTPKGKTPQVKGPSDFGRKSRSDTRKPPGFDLNPPQREFLDDKRRKYPPVEIPEKKKGPPWWLIPLLGLGALIPILILFGRFFGGGSDNPQPIDNARPPIVNNQPDNSEDGIKFIMPFSANATSEGVGRVAGIFTTADGTYFWANTYGSRGLFLIDNNSDKPPELIYSDPMDYGRKMYSPQYIAGGSLFYQRQAQTRSFDKVMPSVSLATGDVSFDDEDNESLWFRDMAYDGEFIYLTTPRNPDLDTVELRRIDPVTRQTLKTWTIPESFYNNIMVLDGKLYAEEQAYGMYPYLESGLSSYSQGRSYAVLDLATGDISRFTGGTAMIFHLCGNSEALFYSIQPTEIYIVKNGQHSLFVDFKEIRDRSVESLWLDGEWLYVSVGMNDVELYRIKTDGSTVQQINLPNITKYSNFGHILRFVVSGEWIAQDSMAFRIQNNAITEYVDVTRGNSERIILDTPVPVTIIK